MRLFIALELNEAVRKQLRLLIEQLRTDAANIRWVDPGNMHLTLKFLGEVRDNDVPGVCEAVSDVAAACEPVEFDVAGVGAFPSAQGARVVWADLTNVPESLFELQKTLEDRLADTGFPPEGRRFKPHLTLGRVKGVRNHEALARRLEDYADWSADAPQCCDQLVVFSSELTREGPIYAAIHSAPLDG